MQIDNMNFPKTLDELYSKEADFLKFLVEPKNWSSIPLLNYTPLHQLKDQSLVRFRGMIQDMQDPEIYLERYEVKTDTGDTSRIQDGKYRDCLVLNQNEKVNFDSDSNVHGERRTFFVISVPGLNTWTKDYEEKCNAPNIPKFEIELEGNVEKGKKRAAPSEEETMDVDAASSVIATNGTNSETNKRQCKENMSENVSGASSYSALGEEYLLNSPIPERPSKACMVKMYSKFDSCSLNSLIDVVGFLSVDPSLDASTMDVDMCKDFDNRSELQAQNPPPSLIPRLHAIAVHYLPHANPLLDKRLLPITNKIIDEDLNMLSVQKDLIMFLTLCLFNDNLSAEYLLSHLISNVFSRADHQCIGKFSLNLCGIPNETVSFYTQKLYEILELLLPASHYLPMTLDILNTAAFSPKKDYETNKLVSGLLQLAPHTHLVLDETRLQQGKLEANGVMGMQQLSYLIKQQQIKCNFQYYEIDYDANIPILVLSEGRSMLPNDFILPIKADIQSVKIIKETIEAAFLYLQPARLDQFRRYLTKAKTNASIFKLNEQESEMVQNDFVEMRKSKQIDSVEDLHGLLLLSRLLSTARGKTALDKESWGLAKQMEAKRRERVNEMPKSSIRSS